MAGKLDGRIGVITGGASGIGRSTALVMGREGAKVVVSDVQEEAGQETVELIKQSHGEARFIKADVADKNSVEALIAKTVETMAVLTGRSTTPASPAHSQRPTNIRTTTGDGYWTST